MTGACATHGYDRVRTMTCIIDLGRMPYREALAVQHARHEAVLRGAEDTLLLVEHPPVITFGRHGGEENLHCSREELARRGVDVVQTERGGNITCHFPGQLVVYPIFRIGRRTGGLHGFVHLLEETVIRTAAAFRVTGRPLARPPRGLDRAPQAVFPGARGAPLGDLPRLRAQCGARPFAFRCHNPVRPCRCPGHVPLP